MDHAKTSRGSTADASRLWRASEIARVIVLLIVSLAISGVVYGQPPDATSAQLDLNLKQADQLQANAIAQIRQQLAKGQKLTVAQLQMYGGDQWSTLLRGACSTENNGDKSDDCAVQAINLASQVCALSAQQFSKTAKGWQRLYVVLLGVSAISTALGNSAVFANPSNAKAWATFGGATGIAATSSAINSVVTSDQGGAIAVGAVLTGLQSLIGSAAKPTNVQILEKARIYAAQCESAAASSPNAKSN